MSRQVWLAGVIAVTFAVAAAAEEKTGTAAKASGLDRLKKLAGTWVALDDKGQPTDHVVSVFKVTSNGSAVQETIFPGTGHEMVSIYTKDGADVVLTHYCAWGISRT